MGMFDTISSAASSVGSPLDAVSNLLAGNANSPANAAQTGKPDWWKGYNFDVDKSDKESAGQAPNLENALNSFPVIEFIHFGFVHTSHSNFFTHEDLSDLDKDKASNKKIKDGDRPRGIQFRSALERESLLLWLFMQSTQTVLKAREDDSSLGGVGSIMNTAGSLFGASGGGSGKTQSSDIPPYQNKVVSAVKPVLGDAIAYKDVHKAGIDLNQARADYRKLLEKLTTEEPSKGGGGDMGSMMSKATSLPGTLASDAGSLFGGGSTPDPAAAAAGGGDAKKDGDGNNGVAGMLAGAVQFTQGVAFKPMDIKVKFYALVAWQQEPQVEAASNEMTYQAINKTMNPFLAVWFDPAPAPPAADQFAGPDDPLNVLQGNMFDPAKKLVQKQDDQTRKDIAKKGNELKGFFEKAPDNPPPGTEAMGMAFNDPPKHQGAKQIIPMTMGDVASQAFTKALGAPIPKFAETVVGAIVGVVLEFTQAVFQALLVRDASKTIEAADLVKSASEDIKLVERLEAIALDKLSFLKKAKEWDTESMTKGLPLLSKGYKVNPGGLADKEADDLDKIIAEKITPLLKPVIEYAMGDLAKTLDTSRQCGVSDKCHTMEWYLGQLPMIQVGLFNNLFFPFWNAAMRAGADLIGGPVGSAIKGILDVADKMKGVADTARDVTKKVGAYADAAKQTASSLESFNESNVYDKAKSDYGLFDQAGKSKATEIKKSPEAQKILSDYPLKGRVEMGKGTKISQDEYNQVKPDFKWDTANAPAASDDNAGNGPAPSAGGDSAAAPAATAAAT